MILQNICKFVISLLILLSLCYCTESASRGVNNEDTEPTEAIDLFLSLLSSPSSTETTDLLKEIEATWSSSYAALIIETVYLINDADISFELITLLQAKTQQNFGYDFNAWYYWLWNQKENKVKNYADFKAKLYQRIDEKFYHYFIGRNDQTLIRLDEIRWGGVVQDGIPPLRNPQMIPASEASYLEDNHIVFGIEINGDIRAYPKRILAWHEMFTDTIDGIPVAGVYCTLCGTVILYNTMVHGIRYELGTSGFLYRSNKLMYDRGTQSLWNTLAGKPVVGPLIDKDIELEHMSVVTTTWAEWKRRHPKTKVLSLHTGYNRNYNEGIAYQAYFSTDNLMFNTPFHDGRLKNKDEILAIRLAEYPTLQIAIFVEFLRENPIYTDIIGNQKFVVLTDHSAANRVYAIDDQVFQKYDQRGRLVDSLGRKWTVTESRLICEDGQELTRLPYHRAFWFGWVAAFPKTRLIK